MGKTRNIIVTLIFLFPCVHLTHAVRTPRITAGALAPSLASGDDSSWWREAKAAFTRIFSASSYVASAHLNININTSTSTITIPQHATNRRESVLCVEGLCATPDLLLLVDGADVSMGEYCDANFRHCVASKTYVNNLKAVANEVARTRWKNVYITCYHAQMPFWVIWVLQGVEDFLQLFLDTISLPGLTAGAAVAAVDAENEVYFGGDRDV